LNVKIEYGDNLLPTKLPEGEKWLVLTIPPILEKVKKLFKGVDHQVEIATDMDEAFLQKWEQALPSSTAVIGIGGGVCMDAAKYVAWKRDLSLWLTPSVVSVDACLTETIGVRCKGRVKYIGEIYPQTVLVDFPIIQSAPAHINRAGAGDILSIHTALWDWKFAAKKTGERYDEHIAQQSYQLLYSLKNECDDIRNVTDNGIRALIELYGFEVDLCHQMGNSRPEEGSEHFWAYNVEYRTKREFVHGELVTLGVLLMSALQENGLEWIRNLINDLGIRWRPQEVGLGQEEVVESLITAKDYVESDQLGYSVINARTISKEIAQNLINEISL